MPSLFLVQFLQLTAFAAQVRHVFHGRQLRGGAEHFFVVVEGGKEKEKKEDSTKIESEFSFVFFSSTVNDL